MYVAVDPADAATPLDYGGRDRRDPAGDRDHALVSPTIPNGNPRVRVALKLSRVGQLRLLCVHVHASADALFPGSGLRAFFMGARRPRTSTVSSSNPSRARRHHGCPGPWFRGHAESPPLGRSRQASTVPAVPARRLLGSPTFVDSGVVRSRGSGFDHDLARYRPTTRRARPADGGT